MNDAAAALFVNPLADLRRVFDEQRAASRRDAKPTLDQRLDALARLRGLVLDNRDAIAGAISADFGTRSLERFFLADRSENHAGGG